MRTLSISIVLLLAAIVGAQEPQVLKFEPYDPIVLEAGDLNPPEGWNPKPLIQWNIPLPVQSREFNEARTMCLWAPPGTYPVQRVAFYAKVIDEDGNIELRKETKAWLIVVEGKAPPEPPDPPQPPEPTTGPVVQVILIRDQVTDTPAESQQILKLRTSDQFARPPPSLLVVDKDQKTPEGFPDPTVQQWVGRIPQGEDLPYFFAVDDKGRVAKQGVMPLEGNIDIGSSK